MTWIDNIKNWIQKLNPAQAAISRDEGISVDTTTIITYKQAFDKLESVNRGVNLIVNSCSGLDYDVKDKKIVGVVDGMRQKTLHNLLNFRPNPYQSILEFRKNIFTDFLLEGNVFLY